MNRTGNGVIHSVLEKHQNALLMEWLAAQKAAPSFRPDLIKEANLRDQSQEFLRFLTGVFREGSTDATGQAWSQLRDLLASISRSRAQLGFLSSATATFVFSFKEPLFNYLRTELAGDLKMLAGETWAATLLLDKVGLLTVEFHQQLREEMIERQQQEVLELSTPVIKVWDGILTLPLIGTLDSARTQTVMENLLEKIVQTECEIAIIDITGVPTVDTVTAQHLLKAVAAARLMGADCIISGIRPQIAQTIVHLGVDLSTVTTKATLADALALGLGRLGLSVGRARV